MKMPKTMGGAVSLAFKILGVTVAAGPAIVSIDLTNPQNIPKNVLYNYTGYSTDSKTLNIGQLGVGLGSIIGGVVLAKLGTILGRMIK